MRVEEAERRANTAREEADNAQAAKEAAEKARCEHAEQARKTLASAKQWSVQKAQEILAITGRAEAAERHSVEMEKWAQQRVHEAAEAKAVALEHAEAARRDKHMAVKHAAEAQRVLGLPQASNGIAILLNSSYRFLKIGESGIVKQILA